jgi:hypothetical protein
VQKSKAQAGYILREYLPFNKTEKKSVRDVPWNSDFSKSIPV